MAYAEIYDVHLGTRVQHRDTDRRVSDAVLQRVGDRLGSDCWIARPASRSARDQRYSRRPIAHAFPLADDSAWS